MTAFFAVLSTLALASLGFVTMVNNPKLKSNRYFFAFCVALGLWVAANYLADADAAKSLFWTRLTFASIIFAVMFFRLFVDIFPRKIPQRAGSHLLLVSAGVLTTVVVWTKDFIPRVQFTNGTSNVVTGTLYPIFIAYFVFFAGAAIYTLIHQYRHLGGIDKVRVRLILQGLAVVVAVGTLFDLVLPLLLGNNQLADIGTYSTVVFAGYIYLAIVRHKLFDIRLIVARSVAYILLVATLAATFAVILLGLTDLFFKGQPIAEGIKVAYITLALILAFIYQPLKDIFDKTSNKVFYRDAYDAQEVMDTLNEELAATIDLEELLAKSSAIIREKLKLEFCVFAIHGSGSLSILVGSGRHKLTQEKIGQIKNLSHLTSKNIIITDELESSAPKLKELLQDDGIGAFIGLKSSTFGRNHYPGYVVLGQKSSGSIYSTQDEKIMKIISDELVIAIQNSLRFEEIQQFNITLQQKVDAATKELRRANTKLKELDEAKDEFISMASHQLRTPLTTVKGYLSMVLEGDAGKVKKEQKDLMQHAFDGADRMVYLIADLLNVSRMQSGKFMIENKPTNLAKVINTELEQLKESAANHHLTLAHHISDDIPMLNLDETKVRQVVMNFLDNAIYYTPSGGTIDVSLQATDKEIIYTVKDTGLGVPASEQHHLFSKFYRAENARKMRPDGTGLGLFMAKKVIAAQGGAIIFKSTEGKGSTFGFSFPRKAVELKKPKP